MSNPMIRIHDMATGQIVDREMTDAEHAQWQQNEINAAQQEQVAAEEAAARTSALTKLKALGLTDTEIAALLGA